MADYFYDTYHQTPIDRFFALSSTRVPGFEAYSARLGPRSHTFRDTNENISAELPQRSMMAWYIEPWRKDTSFLEMAIKLNAEEIDL